MPPAFTFSLPKSSNFPYTCIYTMVIQSWTRFKTGSLKTSKMAFVQSMLWNGGGPRLQLLKSYALTSSTLALCQCICDLFKTCVRRVTISYCRKCPSPPPTCQWLCVRSLPSGDEKHPLCHHRRDFLAVSESLQQIANTAPVTRWKEKSYDLHPKNNPGHLIVNINSAAPIEKSQCLFVLPSKERNEL